MPDVDRDAMPCPTCGNAFYFPTPRRDTAPPITPQEQQVIDRWVTWLIRERDQLNRS